MSLEDDSLEGSIITIQENPVIKESKSKYKYGVEHRFYLSPEKRYKADEPLLLLFGKDNKWRSVRQIVDVTGMAERTVQYACRRFVKHEIFEERRRMEPATNYARRDTRLYRLATKSKNGARRNPRKYETHTKRK